MKKLTVLHFFVCMVSLCSGQTQQTVIDAFSKSYELEQYKEYKDAIAILNKVYNGASYEINLRLGWLHYLNADYPKSLAFYKKAIALSPKAIEALLGSAYPLAAMGNEAMVIQTYQDVLQIDHENTTANYRLAEIYFVKKKFSDAEESLQKVLDLYPFTYNSLVLMARIKVSLGKVIEAKELYFKALLYNPTDQIAKEGLETLK